MLCDAGSIEFLLAPSADVGVIAAAGLVGGRPVVCYAQDSRVAGGSVGVAEAEVIVAALQRSRFDGIPIVGFLESAGARLQEGAAALGGFGRIFFENVWLSGWTPQISIITGPSAGGGCYSPALTDFVVMSGAASMFLTGPRVVKHALGEDVGLMELGGARVHQRNGVCDFAVGDDRAAARLVGELLGYLPSHAQAPLPTRPPAPAPGASPDESLPALAKGYYDIRDVIRSIVDAGRFLEVAARWARNMVVGFARLEGRPLAVVANQPRYMGGIIDVEGSQKGAKFLQTCNAFRIPLLVLVDTPGFMPGKRQESLGVIRHGAELVRAFAASPCPRVTVIVRKAFGGAFITMNSKDLGADAAFSWPSAEIGVMSARAAVEIIYGRKLAAVEDARDSVDWLARRYAEEHLTPRAALERGAIDAIIEPADTRRRVLDALLAAPALSSSRARATPRPVAAG